MDEPGENKIKIKNPQGIKNKRNTSLRSDRVLSPENKLVLCSFTERKGMKLGERIPQ